MLPQDTTPAGKVCGVYAIHDLVTGRVYIGSSTDMRARANQHWHLLRRGSHRNRHLQRAYNQRGREAFVFCVLAETTATDLLAAEAAQIQAHAPLVYNVVLAPQQGVRGMHWRLSPETRENMRQAHKVRVYQPRGVPLSDEHRAKLRLAHQGRIPWEAIHAAAILARGKPRPPRSAAHRAAQAAAMRAYRQAHPLRGERNPRAKLSLNQVHEIRRLYAAGGATYRALGRQFGVTDVMIRNIVLRKAWGEV